MAFPYLSLGDIDLSGKTVILRVDFNSPIDTNGDLPELKGTKRIDDHIENTLIPLFNRKAAPKNVIILSHQGRRGRKDCTTLRPHFEYCRKKLQGEKIKVFYIWDELTDTEVENLGENAVASEELLSRISRLRERTILILENVRFSEEEELPNATSPSDFSNNPLIRLLEKIENPVVALDGFAVAHRAQASVIGLANIGPLYAGPVVCREIRQLSSALNSPELPMVLIVGGAKIEDSMQSIDRFLGDGKAHKVLTGGLLSLTFLYAQDYQLNKITENNLKNASKSWKKSVTYAKELLAKYGVGNNGGGGKIIIPVDVSYAPSQGLQKDRQTVAVSKSNGSKIKHEIGDIGIETIAIYNREIARARTIVMNGPMGRYETHAFAMGTKEVLRYTALVANDRGALALIGGGDTAAALGELERDFAKHVKECSSGKAFLQVLASGNVESLAGIRNLARKTNSN